MQKNNLIYENHPTSEKHFYGCGDLPYVKAIKIAISNQFP
jgi:hypothetical protein